MQVAHHTHSGGISGPPIDGKEAIIDLGEGKLLIGQGDGTNKEIAPSGDVTIDKDGAATLSPLFHPFTETASDALKHSNDSAQGTDAEAFTKVKEILLSDDIASCRIKFLLKSSEEGWVAHGQIYKNGVDIGTARNITTEAGTTYSEDFEDFVAGDLIQIYAHRGTVGTHSAIIENMRIYYDIAVVPLVVTIQDPNPSVSTQAVTNIHPSYATGNGNVTGLGFPVATEHGHCWSTSQNPTVSDSKTELGAPTATGAFTSDITGLTNGLTYYVRAYIIDASVPSEIFYGEQVDFVAEAT